MAGTSETLLEARIISTAFGCLSSVSAGGDGSGTNRSSRPASSVFVMGSVVAVRKMDPGQVEKRMQGLRPGLGLNSSQGTVGPACLGALQVGFTCSLS